MAFAGPRLRRDLISTILDEDGVKCVDVHDPDRGASFRLFDYEYSVALAFDGRPLAKVIPWVRLSTGLELTAEQLTAFAARLDQLGFLESDHARTPGATPEKTPALVPAANAAETPSPVPPQPVMAVSPAAMPAQPIPAEAPGSPVPSAPALTETSVVSLQTAPAGDETLTPVLAAATPPAAETTEGVPREVAEAAPSPDGLSAAEPPAVATAPDPAQHQPWPPAADVAPVAKDSPVPPVRAAESVSTEMQPVAEQAPLVPARTETPEPTPGPQPAIHMSDGEAAEITSQSPAIRPEARRAAPSLRRIVTPPPLPTPTPMAARLRPARARGGPWILYALFGTLTAVAVGVLAVPLAMRPHPLAAVRVRVLVAKPTTVVRWFEGSAPLEALPGAVLSFPSGGRVVRIASPGTTLRVGDVGAATDAARWALADLAKQQERLAYYQQLLRGTQDTGDEKGARAARAQVEFRAGLVEQTQQALSHVAVVAQTPGQVDATLAILGQSVKAGAPALRMRSAGWRAIFELPRTLASRVRKQGTCGAEIAGRSIGCSLTLDGGDETHVMIELPLDAATTAGQMVRLLRTRFVDAFLVPASAVSRAGESDRVLLMAPTGRAEVRGVEVADRSAVDAVIIQGLDVDDAVIVESSRPVGAGARVRTADSMGD